MSSIRRYLYNSFRNNFKLLFRMQSVNFLNSWCCNECLGGERKSERERKREMVIVGDKYTSNAKRRQTMAFLTFYNVHDLTIS